MAQWMGARLPVQGDTGSIPGLGGSCRLQSNQACEPQEKILLAAAGESPHNATKTQGRREKKIILKNKRKAQ